MRKYLTYSLFELGGCGHRSNRLQTNRKPTIRTQMKKKSNTPI